MTKIILLVHMQILICCKCLHCRKVSHGSHQPLQTNTALFPVHPQKDRGGGWRYIGKGDEVKGDGVKTVAEREKLWLRQRHTHMYTEKTVESKRGRKYRTQYEREE